MKRHLLSLALVAGCTLCSQAQTLWLEELGNDYEFRHIYYDADNRADNVYVMIDDGFDATEYNFVYLYDEQGRCIKESCYQLGLFGEDIYAWYIRYEYLDDGRLDRRITANYLPFKEEVPVESGYYSYQYGEDGNVEYVVCDKKNWPSLSNKDEYYMSKVDSVHYSYNSLGQMMGEVIYTYMADGTSWNSSVATYSFWQDGRIREKSYDQKASDGSITSKQKYMWEYNRDKTLLSYTDLQWNNGDYIPAMKLEYSYIEEPEAEEYIVSNQLPYIIDGVDLNQSKPVDYMDLWVATEDTHELIYFETIKATYTDRRPELGVDTAEGDVQFNVYPTVTEGTLHMECGSRLPFAIYDMDGKLYVKGTGVVGTLDISSLPAGMYVVKCGGQSVKIVKK